MAEMTRARTRTLSNVFWLALAAAAVFLILRYVGVVSNVVIVLLGFGSVVLVHEFGHFIVAKLGGIKVEAFSIFMPPTLVGIRKTKAGFRFRVLPSLRSGKEQDEREKHRQRSLSGSQPEPQQRRGSLPAIPDTAE